MDRLQNPLRLAQMARVGFVSLGCPKALVDSESILTRLRAEGYDIAPDYAGSDLVVVNTCGFIDAAVAESLDAIGEALAENGKVIVTGCLGAKDGGGPTRTAFSFFTLPSSPLNPTSHSAWTSP